MLKMIEAIQGKNPCFLNDRKITGLVAPLAHDIGCFATHAGRFVECPEFLEKAGKYENKSKNWWNKITVRKMVHGFVGLDADENWVVAITLPLDIACWGCAGGKYGSYNYPATKTSPKQFAHIQIETCQDDKKNKEFYENAMNTLAEFYAWTIQQGICSSDLSLITCHRAAHQLGFAGNHSDILDWAIKFGETEKSYMQSFRDRVKKYLDAGEVQVEWQYASHMNTCKESTRYTPTVRYLQIFLNKLGYRCEIDGLFQGETSKQVKKFKAIWSLKDDGVCDAATWSALMSARNGKNPPKPQTVQHYNGTVKTSNSGYVTLFKDVKKTERLVKIYDGKVVEVVGNNEEGTTAKAIYGKYSGYVDTQYLTDRVYIYDEDVEVVEPEEEVVVTPSQHYVGNVKTKYSGYVSLWRTIFKTSQVCKILDGELVEVTDNNMSGTLAPAKFGIYNGYIDTKYLTNIVNIL